MPSRKLESDWTSKEKVGLISDESSQHLSIHWNLRLKKRKSAYDHTSGYTGLTKVNNGVYWQALI